MRHVCARWSAWPANPMWPWPAAAQFMDLAGDGQLDLVVLDDPMPGFYEHDGDEGWQPFRPFASRLNRDTPRPQPASSST